MKKKISVLLIIVVLAISLTSPVNKVMGAAPVVLAPAAEYAIGAALAAAGVVGETNEDFQYMVADYAGKLSDFQKYQWNQIALYGSAIGSVVVNNDLSQGIIDYVTSTFTGGENAIIEYVPISGNITENLYGESIGYYPTIGFNSYAAWVIDGCLFVKEFGPLGELLRSGLTLNYALTDFLGFGITDEGKLGFWATGYSGDVVLRGIKNTGVFYGGINVAGQPYNSELGFNRKIWGDSEGLGTALSAAVAAAGLKLSLPSKTSLEKYLDQVEADQAMSDWLENQMNNMNGDQKPDWKGPGGAAAAIGALGGAVYYWLDRGTNEIIETPTAEPPTPEAVPLEIGAPPVVAPWVPPKPGTETKVTTKDPVITKVDNGDGTSTETKTTEETKTETYYDPDVQKWIEKSTTTQTTTITIIDNSTHERTEVSVTVIPVPEGSKEVVTTPPNDETEINWEPLKQGLGSLTNKFPFSLPWDLQKLFKQLAGNQWNGLLQIDIGKASIMPVEWHFEVDFSMFDNIRGIIKTLELVIFDIGLILMTRRLMGGGV